MSEIEEKLKKRIKELEDALEKEKLEKERIIKEFEEFKAKHVSTVFELQKALKIKENKKQVPKPIGAKNGHKGYTRHIPERIDKIKQLILDKCPDCGMILTGQTQEIRHRHVTDISLTFKAKNTRYDIHRKYCPSCDKLVELKPPNVLPHARLGLNLMLFIMYLKLGLRLPLNKICDLLLTCFNVRISEGGVIGVLRQLAVAFGDYYSYLEKLVKIARVKHTDSTSWRVDGKNYYAWVFIACGVVLYKIRKRNNSKVCLSVFGKNRNGNVLVVDRHSAMRSLAEKSGFMLQLCWSHILDDSKKLAKDFGANGKYVHKILKAIYARADSLEHKGTAEHVEQFKGEIFELTQRHYTSLTVWKFVRNLYYRDVDNLFRFVTGPDIDATNNISERELRALVIIRKISNGSRSPRGANATAMLLSVIQTLRLKKLNVLLELQKIVNNPSLYQF